MKSRASSRENSRGGRPAASSEVALQRQVSAARGGTKKGLRASSGLAEADEVAGGDREHPLPPLDPPRRIGESRQLVQPGQADRLEAQAPAVRGAGGPDARLDPPEVTRAERPVLGGEAGGLVGG